MKIGFTGTQKGMTEAQQEEVKKILCDHLTEIEELHHGDCIGADTQFHYIACEDIGIPTKFIIKHPAIQGRIQKRAYCKGGCTLNPKPHLERNHDIVNSVDLLIATPKEDYEVNRSGTWSTLRYARRVGRKTLVVQAKSLR